MTLILNILKKQDSDRFKTSTLELQKFQIMLWLNRSYSASRRMSFWLVLLIGSLMIRLSATDSGDCELSVNYSKFGNDSITTNNSSRADGTIFFLWKQMKNSHKMYHVLACGG